MRWSVIWRERMRGINGFGGAWTLVGRLRVRGTRDGLTEKDVVEPYISRICALYPMAPIDANTNTAADASKPSLNHQHRVEPIQRGQSAFDP